MNKSIKVSIIVAVVVAGVIGLVCLAAYFLLHPTLNPEFVLRDANLSTFNLSTTGPNVVSLTTTFQVTLSSRNPNQGGVAIYYTSLRVHSSYRDQQITLDTALPGGYLASNDMTVWSPFMYGDHVPVSRNLVRDLGQDIQAGKVVVNVKVNLRLKWKIMSLISRKYYMAVNCPVYLQSNGGGSGGGDQWAAVFDDEREGIKCTSFD